MHSHIWWPHSVVNYSLSIVPFLEEISLIFLMSWMNFGQVNHFWYKFCLFETLIYQKIILLMNSSVTSLTSSLEYFKPSSKCSRVVRVPHNFRWPMIVSVMHTNRVDLFFITLNTVWSTYVISV